MIVGTARERIRPGQLVVVDALGWLRPCTPADDVSGQATYARVYPTHPRIRSRILRFLLGET